MTEITFQADEPITLAELRKRYRDSGMTHLHDVVVRFHKAHEDQVKELPGFVPSTKYAHVLQKLEEDEVGGVERFRLIPVREG
jgi:thioredoxin-related protein